MPVRVGLHPFRKGPVSPACVLTSCDGGVTGQVRFAIGVRDQRITGGRSGEGPGAKLCSGVTVVRHNDVGV
jgi:hypothetical protein